jgi:hypothetical protein
VTKKRRKPSLPSIRRIVNYWFDSKTPYTFYNLDADHPGCFACGYISEGNREPRSIEKQWDRSRLERCHLIGKADGGSDALSNLVLLCKRCHHEAPMIGRSAQPMIDWINRRDGHCFWFMERFTKECALISPTLLSELAGLGWNDAAELMASFRCMSEFMKMGYHPQGDMFATAAAVFEGVVKLHRVVRRAQKAVTA